MGGIVSKKGKPLSSEDERTVSARDTNEKVITMLAKKKGEVDKSGHTMTFEK